MQTSTRRGQIAKPQHAPKPSGGESLPAQTSSRMSAAFGHSFSSVRVFHDDAATQQAEGLDAQAFAQDGALFFQKGLYDPHGTQGQRLLAHELTHVVQQDRFGAGGKPTSDTSDAAEREAEDIAGRAAAGEAVQVRQAPGAAVARHANDDDFTRGQRRVRALENYGSVAEGHSGGAAPSPAVPQPGAAPAGNVGSPARAGLRDALRQGAEPLALNNLSDVQNLLSNGDGSAARGTRLQVGGEPLILGGGNSPEAQIRGSRLPNLGTYPEIAGDLRGFGLDDSHMAFAQEIFRKTGQMPEGAQFAGLRGNPDALSLFRSTSLLNAVEGTRLPQHPTDLSIANRLVIEGKSNFDDTLGRAPADPRARPLGGELPATHQMAGASDRAIMARLTLLQDPELLDRLRSQGLDPMQVLLNDRGQGGDALGRRTRLVGSRLGQFNNLLEGGPPADHAEAVPFALDKLSRLPTPGGRNQWTGYGPGTRGSGEPGGSGGGAPAGGEGAAAAPVSEAAPQTGVPTPDAPHAGPAPAAPGTAPASEGAPPGTTGAETAGGARPPLGQAGVMGAAGGAGIAAVNDLLIKRDFSLDSAGDIALQGGAGAAGNMTQAALTTRLGGGLLGSTKAGGMVGAVTSGLFSTYNNGELYRQGKETAGQATANTVVDTGVGLGSGLAGAAAGAAIGSIIPGAGTLVGAGVGFVGGMAASYATNWAAEHSGFTKWAKQGLGRELNHFNKDLAGVWDGVGHVTGGIHDAWGAAKGGLRHAGHSVADGASHALHGAEHLGLDALHGAEHLGSNMLHGGAHLLHRAEHLGANAWHGAEHLGAGLLHGGEHLAARALQGGEHLLHGAEHLGSNLVHGAEHLGSNALHGGAHLLHSAENAGANALHGVEHAGLSALHGAEHLGSNVLHGAENVAHGLGDAAASGWHKLTGWL